MSDNAFVRLDGLKAALSRVKTKVDSDIASAISESTISLTSTISSGDSNTLNSAKSYVDNIKTNLESNITSNLATAKGYTDGIKNALETNITNHLNDSNNPHQVTKSQIGLSNVDNTSDLNKPISTAVQNKFNIIDSQIASLDEASTSVTLQSLGAAPASHTHSTSDITDFRNLIDNLQSQITDNKRVYPLIQRNTSYSFGDRVSLINKPDVYLVCIIAGTTDSSENNLVRSEYFTYDNINNTIIDDSDTSELISNNPWSDYFSSRGCTIRDGSVFWQVCDLNDKHLVGEIIFALNDNSISSEYIPLALPNTYYNSRNLYELKIQNNSIFIKLETFKLIKKLIWSMIKDTTDISVDIDNQSVSLHNNTVSTNSFYLLEFYFENYDQTSLNININSYDASDPNLKILLLFAIYQVIEKSLNNPLTTLQPVSINDIKYSTSSFNSRFNASITNEDYLNFTNNFISDMLSIGTSEEDPENNTKEFYINISFRNINNYFMKIGNESTEQLLQKAGLPNITGSVGWLTSTGMTAQERDNELNNNKCIRWLTKSNNYEKMTTNTSNTSTYGCYDINFNASRSNSIYGNSTTVTPQNISLIPYIKL